MALQEAQAELLVPDQDLEHLSERESIPLEPEAVGNLEETPLTREKEPPRPVQLLRMHRLVNLQLARELDQKEPPSSASPQDSSFAKEGSVLLPAAEAPQHSDTLHLLLPKQNRAHPLLHDLLLQSPEGQQVPLEEQALLQMWEYLVLSEEEFPFRTWFARPSGHTPLSRKGTSKNYSCHPSIYYSFFKARAKTTRRISRSSFHRADQIGLRAPSRKACCPP